MIALDPVPAGSIEYRWHLAESWVRRAVEEGALIETVESYKARCLDGSAQLWLILDHDRVIGAGITEIYDTPKGLTCAVPVVAATDFASVESALPIIEQWARAEGCVRLEGFGRFGWIRAFKANGWRPIAAVIEKDI